MILPWVNKNHTQKGAYLHQGPAVSFKSSNPIKYQFFFLNQLDQEF